MASCTLLLLRWNLPSSYIEQSLVQPDFSHQAWAKLCLKVHKDAGDGDGVGVAGGEALGDGVGALLLLFDAGSQALRARPITTRLSTLKYFFMDSSQV
jgi:hypothetical protein